MTEKRASEIFSGTFLIGLAALFIFGWWWPGILYVLGIALILRSVAQGKPWTQEQGGLVILGLGVFFSLTDVLQIVSVNWLPLLLIAGGLYMLFGSRLRRGGGSRDDLV